MKNLLRISLFFALLVAISASCSKDQRCINWLEGEWNLIKLEYVDSTGLTIDLIAFAQAIGGTISGKMTFEKYKSNKEESGEAIFDVTTTGSIAFFFPTTKETYDYSILNDCETIRLKEKGQSSSEDAEVKESKKDYFVFQRYDSSTKTTMTFYLNKKK